MMSSGVLNFHDRIAEICLKQFENLPKTGKPKSNEWTILSCIVMERNGEFKVVAAGSGSKCIGRNKLSPRGDILNDCHAEIMCRRAFLRFLYFNMLTLQSNANNSILKFDSDQQKFVIHSDIEFHFFTTHVPCGDAATFPKDSQEEDPGKIIEELVPEMLSIERRKSVKRKLADDDPSTTANKKIKQADDIFRTGAKCLESDTQQDLKLQGPEYHVVGVVRTKPGRGVRTLSVSCSDKIAKWSHLGVQGALLSLLLKTPIFLSSFTLGGGTPFSQTALDRALYDRLGEVELNWPYRRQKMIVGQSSLIFRFNKGDDKNPCPSSIAWVNSDKLGDRQVEVAVEGRKQGVTKRQIEEGGGLLKLCKLELFRTFKSVIDAFSIKLKNANDLGTMAYKEVKLLAEDYQRACDTLKIGFKVWTCKDDNLLRFRVH